MRKTEEERAPKKIGEIACFSKKKVRKAKNALER